MTRVLLALLMVGCAPPDAVEAFDDIWTDMDETYGPFAQRGVDWDDSYARWRPEVRPGSSSDVLWDAVTGMLGELDDGHVQLAGTDRGTFFWSNRTYRESIDDDAFDIDVVQASYLSGGGESDDEIGYVAGRLVDHPELLYIHLPWVSSNLEVVASTLRENRDASGWILDLRHNSGGDFTWVTQYMGILTDRSRDIFRSRTRNGPDRRDFSEWEMWTLEPGDRFDDRPCVVLIDRYTLSAGERAVLVMAALPQVTLVGVPTNGSQATMVSRVTSNGWVLGRPVQEVEAPDGTVYEGLGIPPDVEIAGDPAMLEQGIDVVLDTAVGLLAP